MPLSPSPRLPHILPIFLSQRRQVIARAEAKLSLEETENSSLPSNDCSTISVGSPRNGSPLDIKERKKFNPSPTRKGKNGTGSSNNRDKYNNRAEERKRSDSSYSIDAKELRGESPSAKTVPKDPDVKTLERNTNSKTASSQMDCKVSNSGGPSIAGRRGLEMSSMEAIRAGAELMTAGGAGLQSLLSIRSSFGAENSDNGNPDEITSSLGKEEISLLSRDFANVTADTTTAAAAAAAAPSDVFLYVAPCPSPMVPVSPVSAFSGRLLGHEISADPARERER